MRKRIRKKNLVLPLVLWILFAVYIYLVPPDSLPAYVFFYLIIFAAFFAFLQNFTQASESILWATAIVIYLILRQFKLDNILNTLLFLGVFISVRLYVRK